MLDQLAGDMACGDMNLLNPGRMLFRNGKEQVAELRKLPSSLSGKAQDFHPLPARLFSRLKDIGGITAGANCDEEIARLTKGLDLAREDALESVVIPLRRKRRGIGGQGKHWKRPALKLLETNHELSCDMLGIRGATAIPAEQDFTAFLEDGGHGPGHCKNSLCLFARNFFLERGRFSQALPD